MIEQPGAGVVGTDAPPVNADFPVPYTDELHAHSDAGFFTRHRGRVVHVVSRDKFFWLDYAPRDASSEA
jgi:hypothetical protein